MAFLAQIGTGFINRGSRRRICYVNVGRGRLRSARTEAVRVYVIDPCGVTGVGPSG